MKMKCNIEYIGKLRCGRPQYFCTTHKSLASDKSGHKLDECLCSYKELFVNKLDLKNTKITSIKIVYENIFDNQIPNIFIKSKSFLKLFYIFSGIFIPNNFAPIFNTFPTA